MPQSDAPIPRSNLPPRPADVLLAKVYDELRALARRQLARESPGHTLQPTALVHEVYLKLAQQERAVIIDPTHFYRVAAKAMRRILVDHARAKGVRSPRRRGRTQVDLNAVPMPGDDSALSDQIDLISLDEAMKRLEAVDARQVEVVELRYFAGRSIKETAGDLGICENTAKRDWTVARFWLYRELFGEPPRDG